METFKAGVTWARDFLFTELPPNHHWCKNNDVTRINRLTQKSLRGYYANLSVGLINLIALMNGEHRSHCRKSEAFTHETPLHGIC